jgi:hypothetical protein
LGERFCHTQQVVTTFSSYGKVAHQRQTELIRGLAQLTEPDARDGEAIERAVRILQNARQRVH